MRWTHGHSWVAGILFGIVISQHAILLVVLGGFSVFLFSKLGALYRLVKERLSRQWTIQS